MCVLLILMEQLFWEQLINVFDSKIMNEVSQALAKTKIESCPFYGISVLTRACSEKNVKNEIKVT